MEPISHPFQSVYPGIPFGELENHIPKAEFPVSMNFTLIRIDGFYTTLTTECKPYSPSSLNNIAVLSSSSNVKYFLLGSESKTGTSGRS